MWCACCDLFFFVFFFKQKTAYEMRISDWSSDVCSSDPDKTQALPRWFRGRRDQQQVERESGAGLELPERALVESVLEAHDEHNSEDAAQTEDLKSVVKGKSVSERVDPGGRRLIKKKKNKIKYSRNARIIQITK